MNVSWKYNFSCQKMSYFSQPPFSPPPKVWHQIIKPAFTPQFWWAHIWLTPLLNWPKTNWTQLYLYKYENVCLFVCLSVHVFLDHSETDSETLWHKLASCSLECSKTILFLKMLLFKELLPFFYISLIFLCKFEERL